MSKKLLIFLTSLLVLLAVILSYVGVRDLNSHVEAEVECSGNVARIVIRNYGPPLKLYYLTVTEGDEIVEIIEVNEILHEGERIIELNLSSKSANFSIVFDAGVVSGLRCGSVGRSQP